MAIVYSSKNNYLRDTRKHRMNTWLTLAIFYTFLAVAYVWNIKWFSSLPFKTVLFGALAYMSVVYFFHKKFTSLQNTIDNFDKGIRGEKIILSALKQLPDSYSIFHGLSLCGKVDIDFIVTGPTGVFTIEAKSHRGKIGFDGTQLTKNGWRFPEKDVLKQASSQCFCLHDYLKKTTGKDIFVHSILAFSHPKTSLNFGMRKIKNVYVISYKWLTELIQTQEGFSDFKTAEDALKKIAGNPAIQY